MRYWWVNQNQTYRQEQAGGYLWSPKRNSNGARNPFYETMREVSPGDVVFSFVDTRIAASPKPTEFGAAGANWANISWKVRVTFTVLKNRVRPKDHIDVLRPLLPDRYAPLQANGDGLQGIYFTELTPVSFIKPSNMASTCATRDTARLGELSRELQSAREGAA